MRSKFILLVTMLCTAFVSANAQNGGNGNGSGNGSGDPTQKRIKEPSPDLSHSGAGEAAFGKTSFFA